MKHGARKRALRMAEMATRNREDALELVQEAMLGLVNKRIESVILLFNSDVCRVVKIQRMNNKVIEFVTL